MEYNRTKCLDYSIGLFDSTRYEFKFHIKGNSTILSTSFGVQLNFLLNNLSAYSMDKICNNLINQQNPKTGLFVDGNFDVREATGFEEDYILWQFTYFTTIAVDMLGEKPQYPFNFLSNLTDSKSLESWLEKQDFKNFWYSSNKIMFLFYFLTYEQERMGLDNRKLINCLFDFLDSKQDPDTGFWGKHAGANLENSMYGAAHIYLFYDYHRREINYKEQIIDNVIKLQNPNGLFGPNCGGACEDYNGIEILSVLAEKTRHKQEIIKEIISKTYGQIQNNQNRDGGFSYRIDNRDIIEKLKNKIKQRDPSYKYSGWDRMRSNMLKSDLWGTYFRILTLAKIERMLKINNEDKYTFYSLPGWGYK